ncbi:MAG: cache and HAMP domain-containing protein, partial [bacterium]|nr:cache and HAMP domain-containing protein [bacterium]
TRFDIIVQAVSSQEALTESIQHGIDSMLSNYERQLSLLLNEPDIQSMIPERQFAAIHRFFAFNPYYYSIYVYKSEGTVNVSARIDLYQGITDFKRETGNILENNEEKYEVIRETFREVLNTKKATVCRQVIMARSKKLFLIMSPIFDFVDSENVVGVASCAIKIEGPELMELISGYPLEDNEILILTDRSGQVLVTNGKKLPEGLIGLDIDLEQIMASGTKSVKYDYEGETYLGVMAYIDHLNGFILTARPRKSVLGFLDQIMVNLLIVLVLSVLIAVSLSFFLARSIGSRVSSLVEGIRSVGKGVVSHRVQVDGNDELTDAGVAFNEMASTLEKHRIMEDIWSREWDQEQ